MANDGGGFGGNVNAAALAARAAARATRDMARNLETSAKSWSLMGSAIDKTRSGIVDTTNQLNTMVAKIAEIRAKGGIVTTDDNIAVKDLEKNLKGLNRQLIALKAVDKVWKGFDSLAKTLGKVHIALFALGFGFLISSIKRVYELQERWTRAIGAFNMKLGGLTTGLRSVQKAAGKWEGTMRGLTDQFGQGLEMFAEFTLSFGRMIKDGDQWSRFGLQLARGFNLGADQAGHLSRAFSNMEMTSGEASVVISELTQGANLAGVSVNQLAKDVGEANDYMVRFGKQGAKSFVTAAAFARQFGISMKELQKVTERFDMFDEAAVTSAKLNTVFGTMVNSLDLLLEDDPAARFEKIRQELLAQGQTFDKLTPKQVRFLTETTGLNEKQVASMLSLENAGVSYAEFVAKQQKAEAKELQAKKQMEVALRKTAQTMYAFGAAFDRITVAIAKAIRPLLEVLGLAKTGGKDFKSFGQVMESITQHVIKFFESLAKNQQWQSFMRELATDLVKLGKALGSWITSGGAARAVGKIVDVMKDLYTFGRDALKTMFEWGKKLMPVIEFIFKHSKEILLAWGGMKALGGAAGFIGNLGPGGQSFVKKTMTGTGAARGVAGALGGAAMGGSIGYATGGGTAGGAIGGAALGALGMAIAGPIGAAVGGAVGGWLGKNAQDLITSLFEKKTPAEKELEKQLNIRKNLERDISRIQERRERMDQQFARIADAIDTKKRREDEQALEAVKGNRKETENLVKTQKKYWEGVEALRRQAEAEFQENIKQAQAKAKNALLENQIANKQFEVDQAHVAAERAKQSIFPWEKELLQERMKASMGKADVTRLADLEKKHKDFKKTQHDRIELEKKLQGELKKFQNEQLTAQRDLMNQEFAFSMRRNVMNVRAGEFQEFLQKNAGVMTRTELEKKFFEKIAGEGDMGAREALKSFEVPVHTEVRGMSSVGAPAAAVEPPKRATNYAAPATQPQKQQITASVGNVFLDGTKVGRVLTHQMLTTTG